MPQIVATTFCSSDGRPMSAKQFIGSGLAAALLLSSLQPALAADSLDDKVSAAIDEGVDYLKQKQQKDGDDWNWEITDLSPAWPGGSSCLAALALLKCGVKANDPVMERALPYLRGLKPNQTYVIALQTMVLRAAGQAR